MVNRLWQQYFGRGLVETDNDFGTQGTPPSHPELLDWLATEFIAQLEPQGDAPADRDVGDLSPIVARPAGPGDDRREQRLLARQSRFRLDAEIVRDVWPRASGLLSRRSAARAFFRRSPTA